MGLRVQTQVSGNAFILHCEGRIVFGDLRERVTMRARSDTHDVVSNYPPLAAIPSRSAS